MRLRSIILSAIFAISVVSALPAYSEIITVPCYDGGGSGGWMFSDRLPKKYFPLTIVAVNEVPLRSIKDHPMYDPKAPWNKYGYCAVVPSHK